MKLGTSHGSSGFSLIELLAAISILIGIVLMIAIVFTESDRTWTIGTGRADINGAGRAAIDLLARDIEYSLADETLSFSIAVDKDKILTYGSYTNDQICAVSLQNTATNGQRAVREVYYWVRNMQDEQGNDLSPARYELVRGYYDDAIIGASSSKHCYFNKTWYTGGANAPNRPSYNGTVAENVAGFAIYVSGKMWDQTQILKPNYAGTNFYSLRPNSLPNKTYNSDDISYSNALPAYVDIVLDLLDEKHAMQVANTTGTAQRDLLDRNTRRFTSRIYFQNANGYAVR